MRVLRTQVYEEVLRYLFSMLYESFIKKHLGKDRESLNPANISIPLLERYLAMNGGRSVTL